MRHTIRKQIFDLWVHRQLDAIALQQRVSDRFWIDIAPELEAQFDNVSDDENTVIIERLEIDLGHISEEMIDNGGWALLFREKLEAALQQSLIDVSLQHGGRIIPGVDNIFSQWTYFIKHGYLPWNAGRPSSQWFQQVLESLAGNYDSAAVLRKLISSNSIVAERIVLHHSREFLSHLIELLTAENQSGLPPAIRDLAAWLNHINIKYSPAAGMSMAAIERMIWMKVLEKTVAEEPMQDTPAIITYLVTGWLQLAPELLYSLVRHQTEAEKFPFIDPVIAHITNEVIKEEADAAKPQARNTTTDPREKQPGEKIRAPSPMEAEKVSHEQGTIPADVPGQALEQISKKLSEKKAAADTVSKEQIMAAKEGIYITHAGLVLLHPFLNTFFKKLDLVKDGKFIDEASQERAVCLMHELAVSETPLMEYDLVIEKLLCAWPMHLPVDTGIELTDMEKQEVQNLLSAAIEQWEILKNSTPLALQETFLQREGKLVYRNEKWYLQIEKKPVDVLLAHLPWMISMIKLPWMKELLMVEWI